MAATQGGGKGSRRNVEPAISRAGSAAEDQKSSSHTVRPLLPHKKMSLERRSCRISRETSLDIDATAVYPSGVSKSRASDHSIAGAAQFASAAVPSLSSLCDKASVPIAAACSTAASSSSRADSETVLSAPSSVCVPLSGSSAQQVSPGQDSSKRVVALPSSYSAASAASPKDVSAAGATTPDTAAEKEANALTLSNMLYSESSTSEMSVQAVSATTSTAAASRSAPSMPTDDLSEATSVIATSRDGQGGGLPRHIRRRLAGVLDACRRARCFQFFLQPVDPVALDCPSYYDEIKHPMDCQTMEDKLLQHQLYSSEEQFLADMLLIFRNCRRFNRPGHAAGDFLLSLCSESEEKFFAEWSRYLKESGKSTKQIQLFQENFREQCTQAHAAAAGGASTASTSTTFAAVTGDGRSRGTKKEKENSAVLTGSSKRTAGGRKGGSSSGSKSSSALDSFLCSSNRSSSRSGFGRSSSNNSRRSSMSSSSSIGRSSSTSSDSMSSLRLDQSKNVERLGLAASVLASPSPRTESDSPSSSPASSASGPSHSLGATTTVCWTSTAHSFPSVVTAFTAPALTLAPWEPTTTTSITGTATIPTLSATATTATTTTICSTLPTTESATTTTPTTTTSIESCPTVAGVGLHATLKTPASSVVPLSAAEKKPPALQTTSQYISATESLASGPCPTAVSETAPAEITTTTTTSTALAGVAAVANACEAAWAGAGNKSGGEGASSSKSPIVVVKLDVAESATQPATDTSMEKSADEAVANPAAVAAESSASHQRPAVERRKEEGSCAKDGTALSFFCGAAGEELDSVVPNTVKSEETAFLPVKTATSYVASPVAAAFSVEDSTKKTAEQQQSLFCDVSAEPAAGATTNTTTITTTKTTTSSTTTVAAAQSTAVCDIDRVPGRIAPGLRAREADATAEIVAGGDDNDGGGGGAAAASSQSSAFFERSSVFVEAARTAKTHSSSFLHENQALPFSFKSAANSSNNAAVEALSGASSKAAVGPEESSANASHTATLITVSEVTAAFEEAAGAGFESCAGGQSKQAGAQGSAVHSAAEQKAAGGVAVGDVSAVVKGVDMSADEKASLNCSIRSTLEKESSALAQENVVVLDFKDQVHAPIAAAAPQTAESRATTHCCSEPSQPVLGQQQKVSADTQPPLLLTENSAATGVAAVAVVSAASEEAGARPPSTFFPGGGARTWEMCCKDYLVRPLKSDRYSYLFSEPVASSTELPEAVKTNYAKVILKPMDYKTIWTKLTHRQYTHPEEFKEDVLLVFDNCMLFNPLRDEECGWLHEVAHKQKVKFLEKWKKWAPKILDCFCMQQQQLLMQQQQLQQKQQKQQQQQQAGAREIYKASDNSNTRELTSNYNITGSDSSFSGSSGISSVVKAGAAPAAASEKSFAPILAAIAAVTDESLHNTDNSKSSRIIRTSSIEKALTSEEVGGKMETPSFSSSTSSESKRTRSMERKATQSTSDSRRIGAGVFGKDALEDEASVSLIGAENLEGSKEGAESCKEEQANFGVKTAAIASEVASASSRGEIWGVCTADDALGKEAEERRRLKEKKKKKNMKAKKKEKKLHAKKSKHYPLLCSFTNSSRLQVAASLSFERKKEEVASTQESVEKEIEATLNAKSQQHLLLENETVTAQLSAEAADGGGAASSTRAPLLPISADFAAAPFTQQQTFVKQTIPEDWGNGPVVVAEKTEKISEKILKTLTPVLDEEEPPVLVEQLPPVLTGEISPVLAEKVPPFLAEKIPPVLAEKVPPDLAEKVPPVLAENVPPVLTEKAPLVLAEKVQPILTETLPPVLAGDVAPVLAFEEESSFSFTGSQYDRAGSFPPASKSDEEEELMLLSWQQRGITTTAHQLPSAPGGDVDVQTNHMLVMDVMLYKPHARKGGSDSGGGDFGVISPKHANQTKSEQADQSSRVSPRAHHYSRVVFSLKSHASNTPQKHQQNQLHTLADIFTLPANSIDSYNSSSICSGEFHTEKGSRSVDSMQPNNILFSSSDKIDRISHGDANTGDSSVDNNSYSSSVITSTRSFNKTSNSTVHKNLSTTSTDRISSTDHSSENSADIISNSSADTTCNSSADNTSKSSTDKNRSTTSGNRRKKKRRRETCGENQRDFAVKGFDFEEKSDKMHLFIQLPPSQVDSLSPLELQVLAYRLQASQYERLTVECSRKKDCWCRMHAFWLQQRTRVLNIPQLRHPIAHATLSLLAFPLKKTACASNKNNSSSSNTRSGRLLPLLVDLQRFRRNQSEVLVAEAAAASAAAQEDVQKSAASAAAAMLVVDSDAGLPFLGQRRMLLLQRLSEAAAAAATALAQADEKQKTVNLHKQGQQQQDVDSDADLLVFEEENLRHLFALESFSSFLLQAAGMSDSTAACFSPSLSLDQDSATAIAAHEANKEQPLQHMGANLPHTSALHLHAGLKILWGCKLESMLLPFMKRVLLIRYSLSFFYFLPPLLELLPPPSAPPATASASPFCLQKDRKSGDVCYVLPLLDQYREAQKQSHFNHTSSSTHANLQVQLRCGCCSDYSLQHALDDKAVATASGGFLQT